MPDKIVIDASVALKWQFMDEYQIEEAVNLLLDYKENKVSFIVPVFFYYEIANAIHIASRRKRITEEQGNKILKDMLEIETTIIDSIELLQKAYLNAKKYGISVYDSIYLTLSKVKGIPFYTGDKKLYNISSGKKLVRWIGDYKL